MRRQSDSATLEVFRTSVSLAEPARTAGGPADRTQAFARLEEVMTTAANLVPLSARGAAYHADNGTTTAEFSAMILFYGDSLPPC